MEKFLKGAIFILLLIPIFSLAAYNSAQLQSTTNITLTIGDGSSKTFNVSGTNAESITVNQSAGTFTLNLASGGWSDINIASANRLTFGITPTSVTYTFTCGASNSTLLIQRGSGQDAVAIVITPSATVCTSSSTNVPSGGGGGSSGGGGGGGYVSPTPASTTPPVPPSVPAACPLGQPVASAVFNQDLQLGARNDDVRRLQELLATDSSIYPQGLATGYFGSATQSAVKAFQAKHGLPTVGRVGPATRAKLSVVFGVVTTTTPCPPASPVALTVSPVFNSGFGRGASNEAVKRLQILLNSDPDTRVAVSGVGSPGNETQYFGALTVSAVGKFQLKYSIVSAPTDPGYGYVGPKTRTKLLEIFNK